jgi:peroxin-19
MQQQFEEMFKNFGGFGSEAPPAVPAAAVAAAAAAASSSTSTKAATSAPATDAGGEESFQDTIKKTMDRMRTSGEQATAAAAADGGDDFLNAMMNALRDTQLGEDGGDEKFSNMLLGMMEELTTKEILYEPMKELNLKFPEWMEKNKEKVPKEDLERYESQQVIVREIVTKFESSTYADSNVADRQYIMERVQKVCPLHLITRYRLRKNLFALYAPSIR